MRVSHTFLFVTCISWQSIALSQGSYNQNFTPDEPAPDGFRTNRTSYSAIMDVLESDRPTVTDTQLERLKEVPSK